MKDNVWSFHYQYRNVNPFMESFRDEKFTTRHKRHNPIPHSWLSSCGKIEIPHSRLRRSWGISISPRLLSHSWGIGISLLWLVVNFQFLHLRLCRSCRNYPVPETFHKWIGSLSVLSILKASYCALTTHPLQYKHSGRFPEHQFTPRQNRFK